MGVKIERHLHLTIQQEVSRITIMDRPIYVHSYNCVRAKNKCISSGKKRQRNSFKSQSVNEIKNTYLYEKIQTKSMELNGCKMQKKLFLPRRRKQNYI